MNLQYVDNKVASLLMELLTLQTLSGVMSSTINQETSVQNEYTVYLSPGPPSSLFVSE